MAWNLGSTTLPDPKGVQRRHVEKSTYHDMVNGTSKKHITSRKEQTILTFTRLPQTTVAGILAEYALKQALPFSATDGQLQIAERLVHVDIPQRDYNTKGSEFREDVNLILTDVNSRF